MDHAGTPRCTLAPWLGLVLGFGCVTTVEPAVETETDSGAMAWREARRACRSRWFQLPPRQMRSGRSVSASVTAGLTVQSLTPPARSITPYGLRSVAKLPHGSRCAAPERACADLQ